MKKRNTFKHIMSIVLSLCIMATTFVGIVPEVSAEGTPATEVIYCGHVLNAQNPYLVASYSLLDGFQTRVLASEAEMTDAEFVLAQFDAQSGTLSYKNGMALTTADEGYEPDFAWGTYLDVTQIGDDYYGIKANGDLTVDLGGYNNFIYCNWHILYTSNLYGIYADGDVTIKGDGCLKLPATLAMNMDETNGDANEVPHYSYGIYATGDVNLSGGDVMIYSKNTNKWGSGSNANSIGVHSGGTINLLGTTFKFRYEETVADGVIIPFEGDLQGDADYVKKDITNISMSGNDYYSLGFCSINNSAENNNCYNYYIPCEATGVLLNKRAIKLKIGERQALVAKVTPDEAENTAVTWESSNKAVATVAGGVVTAVGAGTATVTVTTVDGGFTNTCVVTVTDGTVGVTKVNLNRDTEYLEIGQTSTLVATVSPENATDKTVVWESSDEDVAKVTGGVVTAIGEGTATITVTTTDGGFTASCRVIVSKPEVKNPATEVIYSGATLDEETPYLVIWLDPGNGLQFRAQADETLGKSEYLFANFDATTGTLTYTDSRTLVTDTNGYEPDFAWNSSLPTVKIGEDHYGIKANGDLTIDMNGTNNFIYANWNTIFSCNLYGLWVDGDVTITGNGYLKLPATLAMNMDETNGDGNAEPHYSYGIYASGDVNIENGTVMIYSKNTNYWKSGSNANSIGIHADGKINLGGTVKFRYEDDIADGNIVHFNNTPEGNYSKRAITNIGMSSGQYASLGFCYINNSKTNNNCFDYFVVKPASGISISEKALALRVGETAVLSATVTPADASDKTVVWKSSNENVATVSGGTVTALAAGSATITATSADGKVSGSCSLVVISGDGSVGLVVDGISKTLTNPIEIYGDVVYVPLVETFAHLGVTMTQYSADVYTGKGNNGDIVVRAGRESAEVDWVDIELPGPVYKKGNVVMVPAYFIEDAVKTTPAVYDAQSKTLTVKSPDPNDTFEGYNNKVGEAMKKLSGTKVLGQSDILVSSSRTWANSRVTASDVSETINGTKQTVVQFTNGTMPYGEVAEAGDMYYVIELDGKQSISEGDVGVVHLKARAIASDQDTGEARAQLMYERSSDWCKLGYLAMDIKNDEWNDYYLPFKAVKMGTKNDGSWPASTSQIKFNLGGYSQTIQIADFEFIYYGKTVSYETLNPDAGSYHGMEEDALWRKEAYRRIEKYRKEDVAVTVKDQSGNPVEGVEIEVKQTESDFMFGTEVCYDEIIGLDLTSEVGRLRDAAFDSFNFAVCGLEMKMDKVIRADGAQGIEMANEFFKRNKRMRGHALFWDNSLADVLSDTGDYTDLTYEELYRRIMDYIEPYVYAFKGKVVQWDVLNEIYNFNYLRTNFDTTRLYTDILNAVHRIDPDAKLYINETHTQGKDKGYADFLPTYTALIQRLKDEGAHIDGIGLQTHAREYHYPQGLYHQITECAEVVDEVAITEYDFDNQYTKNKTQYMTDNIISAFSHPNCSAFVVWGYNAPAHYEKVDFFYDMNWNEQPMKAIWDKMVFEDFRTNINVTSDGQGRADFRGFHGDYEITVRYGGQEYTFDFGLLKDGVNTIEITLGDNTVYGAVSSGKYIEVPSEIEYKSLSEAKLAYQEEYGVSPYTSVALESRFRGVANQTLVSNGGTLSSSADYTAGKVWGSTTGMSAVATDEASGKGMALKNGASGSYTMRHLYNSGEIRDSGNMEISYFVETLASRRDGFALDMGFATSSVDINFGKIKTSSSGYFLETLSGNKIKLSDNTIYDVQITLLQTEYPNVYDVKYTVRQNNEVVGETVEKQSKVNNLHGLKGISLTATGNGAQNSNVMILRLARAKFYTYDPLLSFETVGTEAELISDPMLHFNVADITISTEDAGYLNGDKWGSDLDDPSVYYGYFTETDHLFALRAKPNGEATVSRKLGMLSEGEELEIKFDYYVAAPATAYNSSSYVDVRLESADAKVRRTLVRYDTNNSKIQLLGNAAGSFVTSQSVPGGALKSGFNKNNLVVVCKITPNSTGGYDATLTLTNDTANTLTATLPDILTAEEFLALDRFSFVNCTRGAGTLYGKGIAGIKNIIVTKSGATTIKEGNKVGIRFNNPTERPFDTKLMLVRYIDNQFSSMSVCDEVKRDQASGYLTIRADRENPEENNFMVMLLDGEGKMKPLKSAEYILID